MTTHSGGLILARVQAELGLLVEARAAAVEVVNLSRQPNEPDVFLRARVAAKALASELDPRVPSLRTVVKPASVAYRLTIDAPPHSPR